MPWSVRRIFLPACLLLLSFSVHPAQASVILNTLQGGDMDDLGWTGRLDGLLSGSGGNTERLVVETGGLVQWQGQRNRYRLQLAAGYQESNNLETARNLVVHLRHNRQLAGRWSTVSFVQMQHNPFQRLDSRWLAGFGPRFDLRRDNKGVLAVGTIPMLEVERIKGAGGHVSRGRLSAFLHMARQLNSNTKLDAVIFWQPLFGDFSASRTVGNVTLTVAMSGAVDLKVGAAIEDNARPPVGVVRTDWSTFMGLGVNF